MTHELTALIKTMPHSREQEALLYAVEQIASFRAYPAKRIRTLEKMHDILTGLPPACQWTHDADGYFATACGESICFDEEFEPRLYVHCPKCGRTISRATRAGAWVIEETLPREGR